ncbi:synaptic vesicle transporter SV2 [Fusarium circinatum]|uniref:Synaptic vesicle transporter SV2 n=1 Tax=Fusarium circinatum TaxID=48490 RepID=A0A8H5WJT7_FUSCI|nr:synaptic vesicle transporter SV2 [Fusarium circinatum]
MSDKSNTGGPVTMSHPSDKLSDRERYADLRTSGDRHGESRSFEMGTEDEQIFSMQEIDPVLDAKMRLISKTMDEIGWTNMHVKLFFLNGFGYAADSLILALQAVTAGQAALEFRPAFSYGLNVAVYTGMLVGVLFWGLGADVIGRRYAFNISLFLSSVFAIAAGASPNWIVLATFVALAAFGAGGNLVLDSTVFLEFLPGNKQWLVTLMACWWGLAYVIVAAFCWPIYSNPKYICVDADTCTKGNNMGWRYVWYGNGALVFVCSILRITVIRLKETPKYLLAKGEDAAVVAIYQDIAKKYNRPCSLTVEALESMGTIDSTYGKSRYSVVYAYTPEVLPSAHRATGNGIAVAGNRIMGLVSSFVAAYGNTATSVPIYVCAVLYIVMAIIAVVLPFEPYGKRSM